MASAELGVVADLLRQGPPDRLDAPLEEQRAEWERVSALWPLPDNVTCTAVMAGSVPAEWVVAGDTSSNNADAGTSAGTSAGERANDSVVLYLHGGGYAIGSVATHRDLAARLSSASGARVLVADYRLAPEHTFPAAVGDAAHVFDWILDQGVDPRRVAVVGDSAGGGLSVATAVARRDAGESLPAAVACFSPWVDLALTGQSLDRRAEREIVLSRRWIEACAQRYLGGTDASDPLASPLYADLRGLCPLLVLVGTEEILFDDAGRLARHAADAGVEASLEVFEDCFHLWLVFAPFAPEAIAAVDRAGAFLRAHLV